MKKRAPELDPDEAYALECHAYGRLTGVSLAIHSIPDAFLVLHTGVGCKYKGAGQVCLHDLARPAHHREGYTEISDASLVRGSSDRIGVYVRSWYKKRKPAFMAVSASTFLEMAGEDLEAAVRRAGRTVPCPVAYLRTLGFDGDLFEGYADLALEVLRRAPFGSTPPKPRRVGILGYFFDRYELDHAANLRQLQSLLESLGLEAGPVLLSGRPYGELMDVAACERLIALPYAASYIKEAEKLSGRPVLAAGLPMGLRGTARWLREVGAWAGVERLEVEGAVRRLEAYVGPQLELFKAYARERLGGGLAVFAETPLAAGLVALGQELGLEPVLVGLRDRSFGGRSAFDLALARLGAEAPPGVEVLESPSLELARERLSALVREGSLRALVASNSELSCLRDERLGHGLVRVELGFPSSTYHVLFPTPYLGAGGAAAIAQRIMNQLG